MKRFIAVLSSLLVLPAFAEVAPIYYEDLVEYSDTELPAEEEVTAEEETTVVMPTVVQKAVNPRGASASGRVASRVMPSGATNVATRGKTTRTASTTRTTNTVNATRSATPVAAASGRGTATRAARTNGATRASGAAQIATTRRNMQNNTGNVVSRAAITTTNTTTESLYSGNPVNARASVRSSSAVRSRIPTITASSSLATEDTTTIADTTAAIDELAQITDFCKAQYTQCMDNYCDVLDDNQGRCSCSKNLKNYEKTELALKQATADLQDVAQKIQYIGLSSDEIETLFTQTEAEAAMQGTTDNTQLKNDLERIKGLIIDVKSGSASSSDSGINMDLSGLLDFSISSGGFDLSSIMGNTGGTASISNQRGEQLYKTATARCKASVLNSCQAQGVDISIITNAYDLEIDKQCLVYERNLTETNDEMASTVRNAKSVLQKARLMVAQQKNAYDLRGCVNALDSCMQDDFVCGTDYENCLDPTGRYIVNNEIVIGSMPGISGGNTNSTKKATGLYETWNYTPIEGDNQDERNAWHVSATVDGYIDASLEGDSVPSSNMAKYLQAKIGTIDNKTNKPVGMCAHILNKCQDYTYTAGSGNNKKYEDNNEVIKNYLRRTLIQIKSAQDEMLADYAEDCLQEVSSCLSENTYSYSYSYNSSNANVLNDTTIGACKSEILTCASVIGDNDLDSSSGLPVIRKWLEGALSMESSDIYWQDCTQAELTAAHATKGMRKPNDITCTKIEACATGYTLNDGTCVPAGE